MTLRKLAAALQEVRREERRLQEEEARLSDRDEVIRLARKNEGLVFPGEEIFRVPAEEQPAGSQEKSRAALRSSRAAEFWHGLRRLLFPKSSG